MNNPVMPTTAGQLTVEDGQMRVPERPRPLQNAITAAAQRITSKTIAKYSKRKAGGWQSEAWEMFDLIGEEHFLTTTLARRAGQARLFVGRLPDDDDTGEPVPVEAGSAADVLDLFGGNVVQRAQMMTRAAVGQLVPGEAYFVAVPRYLLEPSAPEDPVVVRRADPERISPEGGSVESTLTTPEGLPVDMTDVEWFTLSNDEVSWDNSGTVTLTLPHHGKIELTSPDDVILIRAWAPHPRLHVEADSPARSSLPVLRELAGLTEHVSAQIDSRLAGAGILLVRKSLKDSMTSGTGEESEDTFVESLIDSIITPISDRSNASAYAPFVVTVPDDGTGAPVSDYMHHISFASPLDAEARELREEAIRRLALGQDTPPELLLGMASMNHWGAWLVREDVVVTHIEPLLALQCDALTREFLWPVLTETGMPEDEVHQHVIWYSVQHLIARPNQSDDAKDVYDRGELSGAALRRETGFSDEDAPETATEVERDPAVTTALSLVAKAPTLLASPGLPALVAQIRAVLDGNIPDIEDVAAAQGGTAPAPEPPVVAPPAADEDEAENDGLPGTSTDPADQNGAA